METFTRSDDLKGATFRGVNLRGARFSESVLSGVMMRGVDIDNAEIDAPWLLEGDNYLLVNGVDVVPYVEAELDRRFPGRALRRAQDPTGLREAWRVLQESWARTLDRVAAMPQGTVDISIDGEWSFAETLRHLVMATDTWLGRAILELEQPYHPLALADVGAEGSGLDMSVFTTETPTYDEVLAAREDRIGMVTDFLAAVTDEELEVPRKNPWAPQHQETTRSCLHTILEEEWEHHRFAVRDLDAIGRGT